MTTPTTTTNMTPPMPPPGQPARAQTVPGVPPPTGAFQGVSWFAFGLGTITFLYAVWFAPEATVSDRYFLYSSFLFSLFGCLSVAKVVRDKQEGIPVTALYFGLSYVAAIVPFLMVSYNLVYDSDMSYSHRGLLGMAYALAAFAVIAVAKNERDRQVANRQRATRS
ncbi:MAG: hypothetical protein KDC39_09530 [Actinobacteria bacterium]|nr:hypothetical protein [Actinomycetota bacterium]